MEKNRTTMQFVAFQKLEAARKACYTALGSMWAPHLQQRASDVMPVFAEAWPADFGL